MSKKEYRKKYYQKNKKKILQKCKEYRNNHKEECRKSSQIYYQKNKEKIKQQCNKYYHAHKEETKKTRQEYYQKNKEYFYKKHKKWKNKNPKKYKEMNKVGQKKYAKKYPQKIKAQNLTQKIKIPKGQLCEDCNKNLAVEKHHEDYNKPLEVEFLCVECHNKLRRKSI